MFRTHRRFAAAQAATALLTVLAIGLGAGFGARAASAAEENGGAPGGWLSSYVSARALGLGGAYVGAADDAASVIWNPAGLAMLVPNEVRFETARLFEDTSVNAFNFAVPGNKLPSFGLSIISLQSGAFDRTNDMNDPLGEFHEGETAYLFTVARNVNPRLALGTNVKLVRQTVEDFNAGGVGFDLGGVYDVSPNVRLGLSVLNLGGPNLQLRDTKETYPVEFRGGFAATLFNGRGLFTAELDHASGPGLRVRGGSEYWVQPMLALRVGYNDESPGGGLSYRFNGKYQFDYGVLDHPLGLTHRVGVSYRFGGFFASAKASPEIFSPTGETAVTKISLNSRTKSEPDSWSLTLLNKAAETVRKFGGKGQPPAHILWDGKDETGLPLADGIYHYTLEVRDADGRTIESRTRDIEISTGGPQGAVPVIPVQ